MAFQNGNKPIVTNGLVYALDFGNQRTYISGSNTAYPLNFRVATTSSVFQPFTYDGTYLQYEPPTAFNTYYRYVATTGSLFNFNTTSEFTLIFTVKAASSGSFIIDNTNNRSFAIELSTSGISLGYYNIESEQYYTRTYPFLSNTNTQHITCRYSRGTFDIYLNSVPLTASAQGVVLQALATSSYSSDVLFKNNNQMLLIGAPIDSIVNLSSNTYKIQSFFGSLSQVYVYNRGLSYDEIYENYNIIRPRYEIVEIPKQTDDKDASLYIQQANITDTTSIAAIRSFVTGLKNNNLWDKLFLIYPFINSPINLKEPTLNTAILTGSWSSSFQGLLPSSNTSYGILPTLNYPVLTTSSLHLSYLSYDPLIGGESTLIGTQQPLRGYGGNVFYSGSKTYHIYTSTTTSSFTPIDPTLTSVEVLVVAGGGSGGSTQGGGGGAGGLILSSSFSVTPGTAYTVVVGEGGTYKPSNFGPTINGTDSIFGSLIAVGGGGGGYGIDRGTDQPGANGGSGGGGGSERFGSAITNLSGGLATPGQGFDGGMGTFNYLGGGGGGSSQSGSDATDLLTPGQGGSGSYFAQYAGLGLGSPIGWFAGGAGANGKLSGPGGAGTPSNITGIRNTGGGGAASSGIGGSGGSGIVIVSYDTNPVYYTGSVKLIHTENGLSGSIGNSLQGGVSGGGSIGFNVISRTGNTSLTLHKNNTSSSLNISVSGSIGGNLYLNAVNTNNTASQFSPYKISYASIGAGLTTSEVATYYNLVSQLQTNLKRQNTLLDTYSGAAAAYSLRRIGPSGYFGPAIRVRRDSDNALRDIGFTSDGQLDTVGLLDFVGVTGSGFVQTWYDQSGNNKNAIQNTAGSQPFIIISGSVTAEDNKITIYGTNQRQLNTTNLIGPSHTWFSVHSAKPVTGNNNVQVIWMSGTPGYVQIIGYSAQGTYPNGVTADYFRAGSGGAITYTSYWGPRQLKTNIYTENYILSDYRYGQLNHTQAFTQPIVASGGTLTFGPWSGGALGFNRWSEFIYYTGSAQASNRVAIENNINNQWKIYGSATASFDPDYQSFITATGITQPTQSAALETLVSDLKSYGLWNKMKAIYPMITDKYNLYSNTENFSSGWLVSNSSVTASNAAGPYTSSLVANRLNDSISTPVTFTVTNNGSSGYIIAGFEPNNPPLSLERGRTYNFNITSDPPEPGHPFYIMTGSGAYSVDGQYNTGVTGQGTANGTLTFTVPNDAPSTLAYVCGFHPNMGGTIGVVDNTDEHYIYQTVALQSGSSYVMSTHARWNGRDYIVLNPDGNSKTWFDIRNGYVSSSQGTVATASIVRVSGSSANPSGSWYRCSMVFTSSVSAPSNTSIQLANTDGDLTYGSLTGLSGSFLWGAQIEPGDFISPYLSNNTNNAFTTGSIFDQMKFNLKDPRDTDAAHRLSYTNAAPQMGYSGTKVFGSTLVTNYYSSRSGSLNNEHLSIYKFKDGNTTNSLEADIGSFSGATQTRNVLWINYGGSNLFYANDAYSIAVGFVTVLNPSPKIGYHIGNRLNNRMAVYKNQSKLAENQVPPSSAGLSTNNIQFGVYSAATSPHKHIYSFATIGDGLTDYEAKALYWIIQKYQTTLGRQVY